MDVHALEEVIKHLSGRRKQQQVAIKEKALARERVRGLFGQVTRWCTVPEAVSDAVRQRLADEQALFAVLKQQYPWGVEGTSQASAASCMEASLLRALHERARGQEELGLIKEETLRAIRYYSYRVALLQRHLDGVAANSSLERVLALHMKYNDDMLSAFKGMRY